MNYYERAQELNEETIANRRYFHTNAEVGLDMPKAKAYVMKKLTEYGLEPKECGYGVTATLGHGGKCIMLRADMDALPIFFHNSSYWFLLFIWTRKYTFTQNKGQTHALHVLTPL